MSVSPTISSVSVAGPRSGQILRYTFVERVNHWLAALTYIYCLMSKPDSVHFNTSTTFHLDSGQGPEAGGVHLVLRVHL